MECRNRSLIGPLVLIGLGVVLLLANLGRLPWNTWETILKLWPILLIAIGLEVVLGRGSIWGGVALALLVLGLAAVLTLIDGGRRYFGPPSIVSPSPGGRVELRIPHGGAKRAAIEIEAGVGELHVGSGAAPDYLLEGTVLRGAGEQLEHDYRVDGGTGRFTLKSGILGFRGPWRGSGPWRLALNPAIPLTLNVRTGVGVAELDLSRLNVSEIAIRTGVGRTTLALPRAGRVRSSIRGGVGETRVAIPPGTAARIRIYRGIGAVEVNGEYEVKDGVYTSPGFADAANRVDVEIHGGIGHIVVAREDAGAW